MPWLERHAVRIALALAVVHLLLALLFATSTPYLKQGFTNGQLLPDIGAPDEAAHIAYADYVFENLSPPVLRPGTEEAKWRYEDHQPPLYYILAAGWFRISGVGIPNGPAIAIRSLNAAIGAGIVLGVFWFSIWATGRREPAVLAAALAAFLPMLCALDGAVSNDPLLILLSTWALALTAKWGEDFRTPRCLVLGLLVGLAILTKASGLLLVPPLMAALWLSGGMRWRKLGAALAVIALVGGPWLVRNQVVYGDPMAMNVFYATFERHTSIAEVFSGFRPLSHWLYVLGAGTALSFVGIFGYMDIHLPYAIYIPALALIMLGIIAARKTRGETPGPLRMATGLLVILVLGSYISYNLWQVQPQARYLFPALAPICLWIVLGLERLVRSRSLLLPAALCAILFAADLFALRMLPWEFQQRMDAAAQSR